MSKRTLFVVNSEWTRLRRTGLSELSRIPTAVNAAPWNFPWVEAFLIVPQYAALLDEALSEQVQTILEPKKNFIFIPLDCAVRIWPEGVNARIHGELPSNRNVWEEFARRAVDCIRQIRPDGQIDVLAIDWPMAPILKILPPGAHSSFTIDLPPHNDGGMELWGEGLIHAQTVHVPTRSWLDNLASRFSEINKVHHKCKTIVFGSQINSDLNLDIKAEKKLQIQQLRGLNEDDRAMLFIARNRWTHDDQKNYEALIEILNRLLEKRLTNGWNLQFVIGPLGDITLGQSREFDASLRDIASRHKDNVFIEDPTEIAECPWTHLLNAADAQLLPSRFEPCGIAHAQGMAHGVIPICARVGAMGEPPIESGNSFQFEWDELGFQDRFERSVIDAIEIFFKDKNRWRTMQMNAQAAAEVYDWNALTPRYSLLWPLTEECLHHTTQKLAYDLWELRGMPLWDDQRDWFQAESQIAVRNCGVVTS